MTQETILKLTCKKHIKIYKLSQLEIKNKEIASLVGTSVGHVYNTLKEYKNNTERQKIANECGVEQSV